MEILYAYYKGEKQELITCPAAVDFFFISPWGQLFPCSNEFWQDGRLAKPVYINDSDDLNFNIKELEDSIGHERFSTNSPCFNARCMGCWKLYLDDVFIKQATMDGQVF